MVADAEAIWSAPAVNSMFFLPGGVKATILLSTETFIAVAIANIVEAAVAVTARSCPLKVGVAPAEDTARM